MPAARKVIRSVRRSRQRPLLLVTPDVLAHDVDADRCGQFRVERSPQQLVVEPGKARRKARSAIVAGRRSIRKADRISVGPRPDDEATCGGHPRIRLALDRIEVAQLGRQEGIGPARHQQHGGPCGSRPVIAVDGPPICVGVLMAHPVLEESDVANRTPVGLDQRKTVEAAVHRFDRWILIFRAATAHGPEER